MPDRPSTRFSALELETALTPALLLRARVVQIALTVAPLALLMVAASIGADAASPGGASDDLLTVLSMVNAGVTFVALGAGMVVLTRLREVGLERAATPAEAIDVLQRLTILRLAMLEASALFGIVVVLLAALAGRLQTRPGLWWNAAPLAVLVVVALVTFPSRERFLGRLDE